MSDLCCPVHFKAFWVIIEWGKKIGFAETNYLHALNVCIDSTKILDIFKLHPLTVRVLFLEICVYSY